ncbi:phage tail tape measure protein [Pedobacter gandavensis]|uniref:Phage tail tape measure protein n=1 Tax=Pedobacter gandavensis TaxID=2679963 RepID=A0ABR6EVA3_9SPHI|nr:phage tail tape measure protein [Pedobacter gandavensis]MBB2149185.1 phage tail tape measure protein [Pedobacter gandavensis]
MATKDEVRRVSIYINGSEAELTFKELGRGANKLKNELGQLTPGTEAFRKKAEELRQVNAILSGIRQEVNGVNESFSSLKDSIDDAKNLLLAGFSIDALVSGIRDVIAQNAELSDSLSNVQKTTGLTQASVIHLNDDLKKIDTRTAQEDLLGLATVAGKLGISAESDVLAFVKAADQISVALGEDLGGAEEAVNSLGKLTDIFKIKDEYGLEQSLLKVGSAINELGAAGTANEGYLVSFASRMAGIAPAAKISVENILGLGAVMDELSQPVEASTTAIGQFIVGLGKDTGKFAQIAKMSKSAFEDLLGKDANAAMIAVLENVKSTGGGIQDLADNMGMVGEDGARAVTALGALSNNLDLLKKRQALANWEFLQGTSLTNEFNVKNDNLAATLDKMGKKLANVWTDSSVLSAITSVTKLIFNNIDAIGSFIKVLMIAGIAWGTYALSVLIATKAKAEYIKTLIAAETLEKLSIVSTTALSMAKAVLTGNLRKAKQEWLLLNAVMGSNPYALVIAGVVALGAALYLYSSRLTEAEKAQKTLNDIQVEASSSIAEEKNKIDSLIDVIKNENIAKSDRISKVKELRAIMPGYLQHYSDEEILAGKATEAIGKYINALERRALEEASLKKLTEIDQKKIELNQRIEEGPGFMDGMKNFYKLDFSGDKFRKSLNEEIEGLENQRKLIKEKMNSSIKTGLAETNTDKKPDNSIGKRIEELKNQISILENAYQKLDATDTKGITSNIKKRRELEKQLEQLNGSTKAPKKDKSLKKAEKLFDDAELERISSLERTAQAIMDSYAKELSETDEHFRQLQKKHHTNAQAVAQIEKERISKLQQLNEKFRKEDLATLTGIQNEISQLSTAAISRDTDRQLAELEEASRLKIAQLDKEDTEVRERVTKQKASIDALKKSGKNDEALILEEAVARELDILDKSGKLREQYLKSQTKKENEIKSTAAGNKRLSGLEADVVNANSEGDGKKSIDAQIALLDFKHQIEVEKAEETGLAVEEINARYRSERKTLEEAHIKEQNEFAIEMAQKASDTVFSMLANSRHAETDAAISRLDKERETELSNKNLTESQKEAINRKYDEKVKKEKEKAWKNDQRASIAQALINGALAVTKVLAQTGILSPFAIPAIVAGTAAEVALIATQKMPQFEHGGYSAGDYDTEDKSSPSGFVRRPTLFSNSSSGRPFIAGEGYKTEYIISSEQLKDPVIADFVSTVEDMRGVRRFEQGGYSNQTVTSTISKPPAAQPAPSITFDTKPLENKMDQFIYLAKDAWNYRIFEEKQNKILEARNNASA